MGSGHTLGPTRMLLSPQNWSFMAAPGELLALHRVQGRHGPRRHEEAPHQVLPGALPARRAAAVGSGRGLLCSRPGDPELQQVVRPMAPCCLSPKPLVRGVRSVQEDLGREALGQRPEGPQAEEAPPSPSAGAAWPGGRRLLRSSPPQKAPERLVPQRRESARRPGPERVLSPRPAAPLPILCRSCLTPQ